MICEDRQGKLVYIWISTHIIMLEEHPPISGSLMFLSWIIIREHPSNPCSSERRNEKAEKLSLSLTRQSTRLLVYSFTCLLNNQLVYLSTRLLNKKRGPLTFLSEDLKRKKAASYSPALHCSTIGVSGLNFSVRNGKRWNPTTITTWYGFLHI